MKKIKEQLCGASRMEHNSGVLWGLTEHGPDFIMAALPADVAAAQAGAAVALKPTASGKRRADDDLFHNGGQAQRPRATPGQSTVEKEADTRMALEKDDDLQMSYPGEPSKPIDGAVLGWAAALAEGVGVGAMGGTEACSGASSSPGGEDWAGLVGGPTHSGPAVGGGPGEDGRPGEDRAGLVGAWRGQGRPCWGRPTRVGWWLAESSSPRRSFRTTLSR